MRKEKQRTSAPAALVPITDHALPADQHPAAVYLASLPSAASRRTMATALTTAARILLPKHPSVTALTCPWWALRYQHVAALRARLLERYEPATVKKVLAAVRRVLREAANLKLLPYEEYLAVTTAVPRVPLPEKPPAGRDVGEDELVHIFDTIASKPSPIRERDACMVALLVGCGLRRAELVALELEDYDRAAGKLTVRHAKGGGGREVFARNEVRQAIEAWLQVRGAGDGALLLNVDRHGTIRPGKKLSTTAVYKRVQHYVKATPHDMRRTFVGRLLDAGADLPVVQKVCGHKSPITTSRYDRRDGRAREKAARLVRLPLAGR